MVNDPSNFKQQFELANLGNGEAMFNVYLHQTDPAASGYGQLSDSETTDWLLKAVDLDVPDAVCTAAILYYLGDRLPKNQKLGKGLLKKADQLGASNVDMMLGFVGLSRDELFEGESSEENSLSYGGLSSIKSRILETSKKYEDEGFYNKGHLIHIQRLLNGLDDSSAASLLAVMTAEKSRAELRDNLYRLVSIDGATNKFHFSPAANSDADVTGIFEKLRDAGIDESETKKLESSFNDYIAKTGNDQSNWYAELREMRAAGEINESEYDELFAYPSSSIASTSGDMFTLSLVQATIAMGPRAFHESEKQAKRDKLIKYFWYTVAAIFVFWLLANK